MRPEETYALEKLVALVGGSFSDEEDPPDAYIDISNQVIAVEVTRLICPMLEESKLTGLPRLAGDVPAEKIMTEMVNKFANRVAEDKNIFVMISTPINNISEIKSEIDRQIEEVIELDHANRLININDDSATITVHDAVCDEVDRISYAIVNEAVSADLHENIMHALDSRIQAKAGHPEKHHKGSEYWLCIVNEFFLASAQSIRLAFSEISPSHEYDRIYVIHDYEEAQRLV